MKHRQFSSRFSHPGNRWRVGHILCGPVSVLAPWFCLLASSRWRLPRGKHTFPLAPLFRPLPIIFGRRAMTLIRLMPGSSGITGYRARWWPRPAAHPLRYPAQCCRRFCAIVWRIPIYWAFRPGHRPVRSVSPFWGSARGWFPCRLGLLSVRWWRSGLWRFWPFRPGAGQVRSFWPGLPDRNCLTH